MTKTQYKKKMRVLISTTIDSIRASSEEVLNSGCLNLSDHDDDCQLPEAVMTAICRQMAWQWEPDSKKYKKEARNIEFLV